MIELPDTTTKQGQQKATVMLGRLMPHIFIVHDNGESIREATDENGFAFFGINLYHPKEMRLAWMVLNWAATQSVTVKAQKGGGDDIWQEPWKTFIDDEINGRYDMYSMSPAEAQRAWLDKILQLANEVGWLDAAAKKVNHE